MDAGRDVRKLRRSRPPASVGEAISRVDRAISHSAHGDLRRAAAEAAHFPALRAAMDGGGPADGGGVLGLRVELAAAERGLRESSARGLLDKQLLTVPDLDEAKGPFWVRRAARRAVPIPFQMAVDALTDVTNRWTREGDCWSGQSVAADDRSVMHGPSTVTMLALSPMTRPSSTC